MKIVLDTEAILRYYLGEKGAEKVKNYLEKCASGELEGFMSLINLTEFYYILYRKSEELAEEKIVNLRGFGIKMIGTNEREIWKEAAKIKASEAIPLGDSYAAATAKILDAKLLAGSDKHFKNLNIRIAKM